MKCARVRTRLCERRVGVYDNDNITTDRRV